MKKKYWIYGAIALVLITGGIFYKVRANKKTATTYQTAQVTKGTLTVSVTGTGNVTVANRATVNPGITGQVSNVSVKVGDNVKKGQLLFKVVNDQLDTQVEKSYATYLQAKQSVVNAQTQLATDQNNRSAMDATGSKSTDGDKSVADQKIAGDQTAITVAQANADSSYADYQNQKSTAAKRTVTAPIDGTITTVSVNNGDQLGSTTSSSGTSGSGTSSGSSGGTSSSGSSTSSASSSTSSAPIVIDDLSSLKASVSINEVDTSKVSTGQKVSMTFDAIDGLTLTGKVEQISTVGTNSSGVVTYPATISFDSLDSKVKPQMSVTAVITTDVKQDVLMVANAAVKTQNNAQYVLKMVSGKPVSTDVTVGAANDTDTEIKTGLIEGDTVVTQTISAGATTTPARSTGSTRGGGFGGGFGGLGG